MAVATGSAMEAEGRKAAGVTAAGTAHAAADAKAVGVTAKGARAAGRAAAGKLLYPGGTTLRPRPHALQAYGTTSLPVHAILLHGMLLHGMFIGRRRHGARIAILAVSSLGR
jgi:hypothetical protein